MSRETTLKRILDGGIVAVVRSESSESLVKVVQALAEGGVTAAEITFTVPDAVEVIRQVRLMPTGGVDLTTAEAFLKAGACCLGVGGSLVEPKAIAAGDFARIRDLAGQYAAIVRRFRD